ncbi:LysM peptidoglycan-binding domain-containing protein [Paenibacillus sp. GCM10012307]|uniref:LysM peptidoglycan-binding domain-containing protein n=1 Tax=Paenibacillus roseus TaxID=2798579 RepID=A0A934IWR6_9BACL|nr:LysM peptidoglycan-binding domain-containing protein [Paenibacillus roseus]MBJ6360721.1 LysM peptidoglycan-binding domain-containing protein [Paenibacillus roseus]
MDNETDTTTNKRPSGSKKKKVLIIAYSVTMAVLIIICGVLYNQYLNQVNAGGKLGETGALNQTDITADNDETTPDEDENTALTEDDSSDPDGETDAPAESDHSASGSAGNTEPIKPDTPAAGNEQTGTGKDKSGKQSSSDLKNDGKKENGSAKNNVKLPTTYVIEKGDTLSTISEKFYNSKEHVALIAEANNIVFINDMQVGDKITIPALSSGKGSSNGKKPDKPDYSKVTLPATYLVQAGDTLSSISLQFYKSKSHADLLAKENGLNPNEGLKAGSHLTIPALQDQENSVDKTPEYETTDHTVQKGETLYSISRQYYGTDKHAKFLADFNQLVDSDRVDVGTVLKIPKL